MKHAHLLAWLVLAAPLAAQTPVRVGETVSGALQESDTLNRYESPYDAYVVRGRPAERVLVWMRAPALDDVLLRGEYRDGAWVEHAASRPRDGRDGRMVLVLDDRGEGQLHVASFPAGLGEYRLEVVPSPPLVPAGRIRLGETVRGELGETDYPGAEGFEDHYVFHGPPGTAFTAYVDSDAFDPRVQFGTWDDHALWITADNDDGGEGSNAMLAGTLTHEVTAHRLVVRTSRGHGTGAYTLRIVGGDAPAPAGTTPLGGNDALPDGARAVRAGETVEGTLGEDRMGTRRYVDYLYTGEAGELLTIEVSSTAFDAWVLIGRGVPFAMLAGNQDGGEGRDALMYAVLPARGTYVIRVLPTAPDGEGGYRLRVSSDRP